MPLAVDVVPVTGRVLSDQVQLERAIAHQLPRFADNAIERLGAHLAADGGNGAERAALVAAFADAQVRPVPRGEAEALGIVFEIADALAISAVDGEAGGLQSTFFRGLECVGGDPVAGNHLYVGRIRDEDVAARLADL